ncbi:hypothetical protein G6L12_31310 [Agrobacterium rhizogenes]|nr:hypothetical protein [Rhizobium rhizogenes]NTF78990.1 hypothetical protein [Rhizobium rhizogenes]
MGDEAEITSVDQALAAAKTQLEIIKKHAEGAEADADIAHKMTAKVVKWATRAGRAKTRWNVTAWLGLVVNCALVAIAATALCLTNSQLKRMNADSRIVFTEKLNSKIAEKMGLLITNPKLGKTFAKSDQAFAPEDVPPEIGNQLVALFDTYSMYSALVTEADQQSASVISASDWTGVTEYLCVAFKRDELVNVFPYLDFVFAKLKAANVNVPVSDNDALKSLKECK